MSRSEPLTADHPANHHGGGANSQQPELTAAGALETMETMLQTLVRDFASNVLYVDMRKLSMLMESISETHSSLFENGSTVNWSRMGFEL